jgi:hypothetical protein
MSEFPSAAYKFLEFSLISFFRLKTICDTYIAYNMIDSLSFSICLQSKFFAQFERGQNWFTNDLKEEYKIEVI